VNARPRVVSQHGSYVPQESLFSSSETIREKIAFSRPGALLGDVIDVAQAVGAHEDHRACARRRRHRGRRAGRTLSAGSDSWFARRVRISSVRRWCCLRKRQRAWFSARRCGAPGDGAYGRGRTMLVVAHRLSTARRLDGVVVVSWGAVIEDGTHKELLDGDGWCQGARGPRRRSRLAAYPQLAERSLSTGGARLVLDDPAPSRSRHALPERDAGDDEGGVRGPWPGPARTKPPSQDRRLRPHGSEALLRGLPYGWLRRRGCT